VRSRKVPNEVASECCARDALTSQSGIFSGKIGPGRNRNKDPALRVWLSRHLGVDAWDQLRKEQMTNLIALSTWADKTHVLTLSPLLVGIAHLRRPHAAGEDGGFAALSRLEMAVTSCAGAKGLVNRTLFGRPLDGQSSPWVPVT
jgi:hypothetical protein